MVRDLFERVSHPDLAEGEFGSSLKSSKPKEFNRLVLQLRVRKPEPGPGSFVFAPRNVTHAFKNNSDKAC
jgi:hypothetical protein